MSIRDNLPEYNSNTTQGLPQSIETRSPSSRDVAGVKSEGSKSANLRISTLKGTISDFKTETKRLDTEFKKIKVSFAESKEMMRAKDKKAIKKELDILKNEIKELRNLARSTDKRDQSKSLQVQTEISAKLTKIEGLINKGPSKKISTEEKVDNTAIKLITPQKTQRKSEEAKPQSSKKRDNEVIETACRLLFDKSMKEYAHSNEGEYVKFSRREFSDLTHSYYLSPNGQISQVLHKHKGIGKHQVKDKGEFKLGEGGFKTVHKMSDGLVRQVVHRQGADLNNAIAATKVEAFKNSENLIVGHYITHQSKKTGEMKQAFLAPQMEGGMEGKEFSLKELISSSLQVSKGLKVMHDHGWVHCDVKPDNILFKKDDKGNIDARLMDLDLAIDLKKLDESVKINKGSPGYMSPEMMRGECKTTQDLTQNDIFGMGVTFLQNAGFDIFNNFMNDQSIESMENDDDKRSAFIEYMQNFNIGSIMDDLSVFMDENPQKVPMIGLALSMMNEPPDQRPNIDDVINNLEEFQEQLI